MAKSSFLRDRRFRIAITAIAAILIIGTVAIALFPWGVLKPVIEDRLSRRFGRTVTIASMERVDSFGFRPVILLRGVRIPQPGWAGPGDLARVDEARVSFLALPLLSGRFKVRDVTLSKMRLALVRVRDGRTNWRETRSRGGPGGRVLDSLTVTDAIVSYRDAKQDRRFTVALSSDAARGLRIAGRGVVRGAAVRVRAAGPSIAATRGGRWPFTAAIDGDALAMSAKGVMDHPLDTGAMTLDVTARADDLK